MKSIYIGILYLTVIREKNRYEIGDKMQVLQLQALIALLVGIISAEIEFIAVELPLKVKYF
jgi:hypothetical protein